MALILKGESLHDEVVKQYQTYKQFRAQMITSDYILDELLQGVSIGAEAMEPN